MNAETTVCRVLAWAARADQSRAADGGHDPLPVGPLREAVELAIPSETVVANLAELTWRTAARLGAGSPPFGDRESLGLGAMLLAGAIGGRAEPATARLLAEAIPALRLDARAAGWTDALARHAVLAPALAELDNLAMGGDEEPLMETVLRYSPLSTVLYRPPLAWLVQGASGGAVAVARALQARPRGTAVLTSALAAFVPNPAVLRWRTELLRRSLQERPELLADVYLIARLRHGEAWDEQVASTRRAFTRRSGPDELAMATARFWRPLSELRRRRPDLLNARPLLTGHKSALALVEGPHQASIAAVS